MTDWQIFYIFKNPKLKDYFYKEIYEKLYNDIDKICKKNNFLDVDNCPMIGLRFEESKNCVGEIQISSYIEHGLSGERFIEVCKFLYQKYFPDEIAFISSEEDSCILHPKMSYPFYPE